MTAALTRVMRIKEWTRNWKNVGRWGGAALLAAVFMPLLSGRSAAAEPGAPENLRSSQLTGSSVRLDWDGVANAAGYEIRRDGVLVATPSGTAWSDAEQTPLTTRKYQVRAQLAGGAFSPWSDELEVAFPGPAAPGNFRIYITSANRAYLQWDTIAGLSGRQTNYEVFRDGEKVYETTSNYYDHYDLLPLRTYRYQVRANWGGEYPSGFAEQTIEVTPPGPSIPNNLRLYIADANRAYLQWDTISGHSPFQTNYEVFRDDVKVYETTSNYYDHYDLLPLRTYRYKVRANWGGEYPSGFAEQTIEVTPPGPKIPPNFRLYIADANRAYLQWDTISGHSPFQTNYEVFRDDVKVYETTSNYYDHYDLLPLRTYRYKVRANWGGEYPSGFAEQTIEVTPPGPKAPKNFRLYLADANRAYLQWDTISGHSPFQTNYEVFRDGEKVYETTSNYYDHYDLLPLRTYRYQVRANWGGEYPSEFAGETLEVTPPGPQAPKNLRIWSQYGGQAEIAWDTISGHSPLKTVYEVYCDSVKVAETESYYYTHTGMLPGEIHTFAVRARWGEEAISALSPELTVAVRPGVTQPYSYYTTPTRAALEFYSDDAYYFGSYHYELFRDDEPSPIYSGPDYYFQDTHRVPGTSHQYRVRLVLHDYGYTGELSAPLTVDYPLPTPPEVYADYIRGNGVDLYWYDYYSYDVDYTSVYLVYRDGVLLGETRNGDWNDNTLLPGTTVTYTVRLEYGGAEPTVPGNPVTVTTLTPEIPRFNFSRVTGNSITLSWPAQSNTGYNPEYDIEVDGVKAATTTERQWTDSGLLPGQTRVYRMKSRFFAGCESEWSAARSSTTLLPVPPTLTFRSATGAAVKINIAYPVSDTGYDHEFEIERGGVVVGAARGAGEWEDSGLAPGTEYVYRARTRFYHGVESEWSAPLAARTNDPAPPLVSLGQITANAITLNWRDPAVTGYDTEYDIRRDGVLVTTLRGKSWTDSGLAPGSTHSYQVRARFFAGCESDWSEAVSGATIAAAPPSYFEAYAESASAIYMYWDASARANSGYDVEYDIERDGVIVGRIRDSWWRDTGLRPGATYTYRIRTRLYAGAESTWSAPKNVPTQSVRPPYSYVSETGGNFVKLYMTEYQASGYPDVEYDIRRGGELVGTTKEHYWTDTGLAPGEQYTYEVRLRLFAGCESEWGGSMTATTRLPEPPNAGVSTRAATSIRFTWSDRFSTGYESEYDIARDGVVVATTKLKEWTDTGLAPGESHNYAFRTRFFAGCESEWSSPLNAKSVGPEAPTSFYIWAQGGSRIYLEWYGGDAAGHNVEYDVERDGVVVATVAESWGYGYYEDTGLAADTEYTYRVRTRFFPGCESEWSQPQKCRTMAVMPPYLWGYSYDNRSVEISVESRNYNYETITYELECNGTIIETREEGYYYTYFYRNDLEPGQTYTFRARTRSASEGESPWSEPYVLTTRMPEPPNLSIGAVTGNSIYLSWSEAFNSGYATREFDIMRGGEVVHTTNGTSWTDTGLAPGTTYAYGVRVRFYPGMESGWSAEKSAATRLPAVPTNFVLKRVGWDRAEFSWTKLDNPGYAVTYEIRRDGAKVGEVVDGNTYTDGGLAAGADYHYQIRATYFAGCSSELSGELAIRIPAPADGTGVRGRYYADADFNILAAERLDAGIDFPDFPGAPADNFSARWEGALRAPLDDEYIFRLQTAGGVRLWVDGRLAIDYWNSAGGVNASSNYMALAAGRRYSFRLEWRGGASGRGMALQWEGRKFIGGTVPATQFYPAALLGVDGLGATSPGDSVASPAWLEGEAAAAAATVRFRVDGGAWTDATLSAPGKWHADNASSTPGLPRGIVLSPEAPTVVDIESVDDRDSIKQAAHTLVWKTTRLDGADAARDAIHIRQGDSLLLAVGEAAAGETDDTGGAAPAPARIQSGAAGDLDTEPGARHAVRYDAPGEYTVRGFLDGEEAGALKVVVVGLAATGNNLPMGYSDYSYETRSREIHMRPQSAWNQINVEVDDPGLARIERIYETGNGLEFHIRSSGEKVGESRLTFRLNGPDGPVIGERKVQVVSVWLVSGSSLPELHRYPDGSRLVGVTVGMYPKMDDVPMEIHGLSGEMLFDGVGGSSHIVHGRDFDRNGQFNYCILTTGGACHGIGVPDLPDQ